jgi:hypothetical protein
VELDGTNTREDVPSDRSHGSRRNKKRLADEWRVLRGYVLVNDRVQAEARRDVVDAEVGAMGKCSGETAG